MTAIAYPFYMYFDHSLIETHRKMDRESAAPLQIDLWIAGEKI